MASRLLLLALLVPLAARGQGTGVERFFPLDAGNRWVWIGGDHDEPDSYYRLEVIGDTLIDGEPYALATATELIQTYQPVATARCAVRVVPATVGGPGGEIEAVRLTGGAECLPPAVKADYDRDIPAGPGVPMTVQIGGISYALEEVSTDYRWLPLIGEGEAQFGAGVGPLRAFFARLLSQGGGGYGSELVYAEVGGETYGVEPEPMELPDPARFYPLGLGDAWAYGLPYGAPTEWEVRTVVGDTTLGGMAYALVERERLDASDGRTLEAARCAVRYVAGWFEWVAVSGTCEPEEEAIRSASWWRPFTESAYVRADCSVSVNHQGYEVPFCFDLGYSQPPPTGYFASYDFAVDLGLVGYSILDGAGYRTMGLLYARAGGVEYGVNPVAAEPGAESQPALGVVAHPNPFRATAALTLTVPEARAVTVEAFDALGRRVLLRDLGALPAGRHWVELDGASWAPGAYVVRVTAGEEVASRRVVRVE